MSTESTKATRAHDAERKAFRAAGGRKSKPNPNRLDGPPRISHRRSTRDEGALARQKAAQDAKAKPREKMLKNREKVAKERAAAEKAAASKAKAAKKKAPAKKDD